MVPMTRAAGGPDPVAPAESSSSGAVGSHGDPADRNPPLDPIDRMDPLEPMERIEPVEAMERMEPLDEIDSSDPTDRREPAESTEPADPADSTDPTDRRENADQREPLERNKFTTGCTLLPAGHVKAARFSATQLANVAGGRPSTRAMSSARNAL